MKTTRINVPDWRDIQFDVPVVALPGVEEHRYIADGKRLDEPKPKVIVPKLYGGATPLFVVPVP